MAESYSVKAILSAQDKNFSSIMKSCQGYANNLKTTLTGGLGFGAMAAIGGKAMSLVTNSVSDLSKETIETSDSMYKLQAAMRCKGIFLGSTCVFTGNGSRSFTCSGLEPDH